MRGGGAALDPPLGLDVSTEAYKDLRIEIRGGGGAPPLTPPPSASSKDRSYRDMLATFVLEDIQES